jgi:hypothetical protein
MSFFILNRQGATIAGLFATAFIAGLAWKYPPFLRASLGGVFLFMWPLLS